MSHAVKPSRSGRGRRRKLVLLAMAIAGIGLGAAPAQAGYPPAKISRTLFVNPYYLESSANLPYSAPRHIYLAAGWYNWYADVTAAWSGDTPDWSARSIKLNAGWYQWSCYMDVEEFMDGSTRVRVPCYLEPDGNPNGTAIMWPRQEKPTLDGSGDYIWTSTLQHQ